MTDSHKIDRTDPVDDLVEIARSDRNAFGRLFDHFYPPIFAYCLRRLVVRATAEDVTSEIFLKVAASIREFSGTSAEDFRRWLFRIATNEINANLRQTIRRRELLEAAARMGVVNADVSTSLTSDDAPVEWAEVYQALSTGVVDHAEISASWLCMAEVLTTPTIIRTQSSGVSHCAHGGHSRFFSASSRAVDSI